MACSPARNNHTKNLLRADCVTLSMQDGKEISHLICIYRPKEISFSERNGKYNFLLASSIYTMLSIVSLTLPSAPEQSVKENCISTTLQYKSHFNNNLARLHRPFFGKSMAHRRPTLSFQSTWPRRDGRGTLENNKICTRHNFLVQCLSDTVSFYYYSLFIFFLGAGGGGWVGGGVAHTQTHVLLMCSFLSGDSNHLI